MDKNDYNPSLVEAGSIFCGLIIGGVAFSYLVEDDKFTWWLILGIAMFILPYVTWFHRIRAAKDEERRTLEKKIRQEYEKCEAITQSAKNGTWAFPTEKFYQCCAEQKAVNILNEYGFNKARMIAEQLIQEACPKADMSNFQSYLTKKKLQEFLDAGKPLAELSAKREDALSKESHRANPYPYEEILIKRATVVSNLTGNEKRVKMLTDLVDDCETEYQKAKSEEEAWKQLAIVQGMQQKKEKDWSIRAGAASGIAGPVAGMATVLDTMQENEKIRMYNQDVRSAADGYIAKAAATFDGQAKAKAERNRLEKSIEEAKATIALPNPNAETLWENMKVNYDNAFISKSKSGVLNVSLDIRLIRPVHLDVPDGVKMVIDGTIAADVMYEGNKIGEVAFLLPILGMPCDEPAVITLKGICQNSNGFNNGYTLEMKTKQNLWVMEAASKDSVRAVDRFFELYRPGETADQCNEKHSAYFDKNEYNQKKAFFNDEAAENEDIPTRINKFLMMAEKPMTLSEIKAVVNTSTVAETRELMDPAIKAGSIKKEVVKGRVVYSWNGE